MCFAMWQVNFWRSLDEALRRVELQLSTPGVLVTVALLRQARRLIALAALDSNTGLDNATKVQCLPHLARHTAPAVQCSSITSTWTCPSDGGLELWVTSVLCLGGAWAGGE